jgi:uncharacterized membrane protein YqaE (UPF0057 family)
MTDAAENAIYTNNYGLFEKFLYGGLGYGVIVIPTNFLKIIFALIFPPLAEIFNIVEDKLLSNFPYISWDAITKLFDYKNLNRIIYSFVLTSMFYIPGLIYTLSNVKPGTPNVDDSGTLACNPYTGKCLDLKTLSQEVDAATPTTPP